MKFGGFANSYRVNHYNLSSPFKPVKNDSMLEITQSFYGDNNPFATSHYHVLSSPLIGSANFMHGNSESSLFVFIDIF
jgi:hypothetical protein